MRIRDVEEFVNKMKVSNSRPLKVLTDEIHYHTIGAKFVEILDRIEKKLDEKGFLVKKRYAECDRRGAINLIAPFNTYQLNK